MKKIIIPFICFSLLNSNAVLCSSTSRKIKGFFGGGIIGFVFRGISHKSTRNQDNIQTKTLQLDGRSVFLKNMPDDIQGVKFDDIAGIDDVIEEVKTVVDFVKNPAKYKALGAKFPKGILLQGPPGNGKTLLARAIANESGLNFFYESASSFVELYVGVGAKRIRDFFEKARNHKPSIVFIDEIDAIGAANRGAGGNEEYRQTLNELLCQLDGFSKDDSVIVIAATNNSDALDPALKRPGRFTKIIEVPLPDMSARFEIFNFYINKLPNVKINRDVFDQIVANTKGFSAAELENLVNESALYAVSRGASMITDEHFAFGYKKSVERLFKNN